MVNKQRKVLGEEELQAILYHRSSFIQKPLRRYSSSSELWERAGWSGQTLVGAIRNCFSIKHPAYLWWMCPSANNGAESRMDFCCADVPPEPGQLYLRGEARLQSSVEEQHPISSVGFFPVSWENGGPQSCLCPHSSESC